MHVVEAIAEIFSWVGLGVGVPLGIYALWHSTAIGRWEPQELFVVDRGDHRVVRWYAAGEFRERPALRAERGYGLGDHHGYRASRDAHRARLLEPSPLGRAARTLGVVFLTIGVVALVASFVLPLL